MTRRGVLAALGAGALGAAVPARAELATGTWTLFQSDLQNTGHDRGGAGPGDAVGARWGYLDGVSFEETPVVTNDAVFAADRGGDAVVAVERDTGEERWRVEPDLRETRMTYAGGTLYVPARSFEARSPQDGSVQWTANVNTPRGIAIKGEFAYVAANDGVYRVSLTAEQVDWHFDEIPRLHGAVAVTEEYVYAVDSQYGKIVALDPSTGARRWQRRDEGAGTGAPTTDGKRVYVPTTETLSARRFESGSEVWTTEEGVTGSVAVADGSVYATTGGGDVVARDAETGTEQWRTSVGSGGNPPVVVGGLLYVTGSGGDLAALAPGDGTVVWEASVGGTRDANVAVAGGELYVGDEDGNLVALAPGASGGLTESTPTSTATEPPEDDGTPAGDDDDDEDEEEETASPTSEGGPGFGVLAGAVATGAGALAALRRRSTSDESSD